MKKLAITGNQNLGLKIKLILSLLFISIIMTAQDYSDYLEGTLIVDKDTTRIEQIFVYKRFKSVSIQIKGYDFNYIINTKYTKMLEMTEKYIICLATIGKGIGRASHKSG